jgi:hypothetical protein
LLAYLERWTPDAGLKPRPLDQAISSLKQFDKAVAKSIEQIESKHVQEWIDGLINPDGENGLSPKTVNRKLGEINNYWRWLQSLQIVPEDRNPFVGRRVKEPANRKKTKVDLRQRFRPEDVVRLHQSAVTKGDTSLAAAIQIAMFSGAGAISLSGHLGPACPRVRCLGFRSLLVGTDWTRAFAVVNYEQAVEPFLRVRPRSFCRLTELSQHQAD